MAEIRTWNVKSNSYRPDYGINGETVVQAIERHFQRIARDAHIGGPGGYQTVGAAAQYQNLILNGRGGVELTIEYRNVARDGQPEVDVRRAVVWISARPDDLTRRHEFAIRPVGANAA